MCILDDLWGVEEKRVFHHLWKSRAPSKVVALSWKMLLDRIPTWLNLSRRHALPSEVPLSCVLCERDVETMNHLFMHCENMFITPHNLFIHWECWNAVSSNKKLTRGLRLIWHATIWLIWKARNDKIFNTKDMEVSKLVEDIKVLSWRWPLTRVKSNACLFYEWCWDPMACLVL